jgi:restriction system protein
VFSWAVEPHASVERLYTVMGYHCQLTPPSGDGGRDVIATRDNAGQRERRLIDYKHCSDSLQIKDARATDRHSQY